MVFARSLPMNKKIILFLLPLFAYTPIFAQDSLKQSSNKMDTSVHRGRHGQPSTQTLKGYIVLLNSDTLRGYFSIRYYPGHAHCLFWNNGNSKPYYITQKKIKLIRADVESPGRNFTEIVVLKSKKRSRKFWRIIAEKGGIIICDQSFGVFTNESIQGTSKNEFNNNMFLVKGENWINIYHGVSGFWEQENISKQFILEFINKRYHLTLNQSDFKSGMEMIDFILNEETKI